MNTVSINGINLNVPANAKVSVSNGKIYVNDVCVDESNEETIVVKSENNQGISIQCDKNVIVEGSVSGGVKARGDVTCGSVTGGITASGDVKCETVVGGVRGSKVTCYGNVIGGIHEG